jgi:hypothetical protein
VVLGDVGVPEVDLFDSYRNVAVVSFGETPLEFVDRKLCDAGTSFILCVDVLFFGVVFGLCEVAVPGSLHPRTLPDVADVEELALHLEQLFAALVDKRHQRCDRLVGLGRHVELDVALEGLGREFEALELLFVEERKQRVSEARVRHDVVNRQRHVIQSNWIASKEALDERRFAK